MITELEPEQDQLFQSKLQSIFNGIEGDDAIQRLRRKAWERFLQLGLPKRNDDIYRYVPLKKLFLGECVEAPVCELSQEVISRHILPECKKSALVFINGRFSPIHSRMDGIHARVVISTLNEAMHTYSSFISGQWNKAVKEERDPFVLLNLALFGEGLFIYIPPKTVVDSPIQLLYLTDVKDKSAMVCPMAQIFVGGNSQLALASTRVSLSDDRSICNSLVDISIEENSHVRFTQDACDAGKDAWIFDAFRAVMKRNGTLKSVMATEGSTTIRHDYRVGLLGENVEIELNGVSMVKGNNESHIHVLVDHQAPNCRSLQLFKGVLGDYGHTAFEGKILVRQAAQKTEAFQLNNNLLLSDRAHADSKPNLEIFADDVKASHGSTVGQLDSEQIYYMKTRGIDEAMAKNLLVEGYCAEVIDKVSIDSIHDKLKLIASRFYGKDSA